MKHFRDSRDTVWGSRILGACLACAGIFGILDHQYISGTLLIAMGAVIFITSLRNGFVLGSDYIKPNSINIFSKKLYFSNIEAQAFTYTLFVRKFTYIILYDAKTGKRVLKVESPGLPEEDVYEIYDWMLGRGVKFRSYGFSEP